jgi:hypothetical protein
VVKTFWFRLGRVRETLSLVEISRVSLEPLTLMSRVGAVTRRGFTKLTTFETLLSPAWEVARRRA